MQNFLHVCFLILKHLGLLKTTNFYQQRLGRKTDDVDELTTHLTGKRLHHRVVVETNHHKVVETSESLLVFLVDGDFVVELGQEDVLRLVGVFVSSVVPVLRLNEPGEAQTAALEQEAYFDLEWIRSIFCVVFYGFKDFQ